MTRVGQKVKMTSLDELLCVPAIEGTKDIEIDLINQFKEHPFKVTDDSRMDELVESIKANGILSPVIVRPLDNGRFEMISGHRRMHAAGRAGLTKIPAIVKPLCLQQSKLPKKAIALHHQTGLYELHCPHQFFH